MNSITAIIPVREGSRRLKNKNVAPFAGTNLLINKINQLKQVKEITNIVVSSDSDNMLEMARLQGVSTHKRAVEFCDEKSKTFGEVYVRMLMVMIYYGQLVQPRWCFLNNIKKQFLYIIKLWKMDMIHWCLWKSSRDICGMIMAQ